MRMLYFVLAYKNKLPKKNIYKFNNKRREWVWKFHARWILYIFCFRFPEMLLWAFGCKESLKKILKKTWVWLDPVSWGSTSHCMFVFRPFFPVDPFLFWLWHEHVELATNKLIKKQEPGGNLSLDPYFICRIIIVARFNFFRGKCLRPLLGNCARPQAVIKRPSCNVPPASNSTFRYVQPRHSCQKVQISFTIS